MPPAVLSLSPAAPCLSSGCSMPSACVLDSPQFVRGYGGHAEKRLVSFRESLVASFFKLMGVEVTGQLF